MAETNARPVCGFIGLGGQGAPMARRMIAAGFPTVLWARRPETLEPYRESGASFAASVAELGRAVDHVGVCVVNDDDVRQVCGELMPAMREGGRIAIHATVHPDTCRALAAEARARGLAVVDAPVSGGGPVAEAGGLVVMVGGDPADVAAARPVFESFGSTIVHLGPVGAGQEAKLINNTLFAANLGMAHDALRAAAALGMSEAAFVELIRASSGRSYGFEVRARMPPPEKFRHAGELLAKDVRLLGEVLGEGDPAFRPLRDSAGEFLSYVLGAAEG
jgi:3-hydroxyisobutyrate dehydrogenase-like beta-hydroxyacid dehydrogenase